MADRRRSSLTVPDRRRFALANGNVTIPRAIITLYLAMLSYGVGDCFRSFHYQEKTPPGPCTKRQSNHRLALTSKSWEIVPTCRRIAV